MSEQRSDAKAGGTCRQGTESDRSYSLAPVAGKRDPGSTGQEGQVSNLAQGTTGTGNTRDLCHQEHSKTQRRQRQSC